MHSWSVDFCSSKVTLTAVSRNQNLARARVRVWLCDTTLIPWSALKKTLIQFWSGLQTLPICLALWRLYQIWQICIFVSFLHSGYRPTSASTNKQTVIPCSLLPPLFFNYPECVFIYHSSRLRSLLVNWLLRRSVGWGSKQRLLVVRTARYSTVGRHFFLDFSKAAFVKYLKTFTYDGSILRACCSSIQIVSKCVSMLSGNHTVFTDNLERLRRNTELYAQWKKGCGYVSLHVLRSTVQYTGAEPK